MYVPRPTLPSCDLRHATRRTHGLRDSTTSLLELESTELLNFRLSEFRNPNFRPHFCKHDHNPLTHLLSPSPTRLVSPIATAARTTTTIIDQKKTAKCEQLAAVSCRFCFVEGPNGFDFNLYTAQQIELPSRLQLKHSVTDDHNRDAYTVRIHVYSTYTVHL